MKNDKFTAHAVCPLFNDGGIEIMISKKNDEVIYRYFGKIAKRWQEIKYTNSGRPFFRVYGRVYYIDQFMIVR